MEIEIGWKLLAAVVFVCGAIVTAFKARYGDPEERRGYNVN